MEWSISISTLIVAGAVLTAVALALIFGKYEPGSLLHAVGSGLSRLILCGLIFWGGFGLCLHLQVTGGMASVAPSIPVDSPECLQARNELESLRTEYNQLLDAFEPTPKKVARR